MKRGASGGQLLEKSSPQITQMNADLSRTGKERARVDFEFSS